MVYSRPSSSKVSYCKQTAKYKCKQKKFCLHFLKIKVGFFSLSAQTLSKEAKMGEMHREMPKLANCDM